MRRKMLVSSVAACAVAFSCAALLLGKTLASSATDGESGGDGAESAAGVGPVGDAYSATGSGNGSRSHFAVFDAVTGETHTFPAPRGDGFPSGAPRRGTDSREERGNGSGSGKHRRRRRRRRRGGKQETGKLRNFVSRDVLRDSEAELRVHLGGVTAKETMISSGIDEITGKRQGLKLRQLTDGENFIQLIYNLDDEIQDCEFIRRKDLAERFLREFEGDVERAEVAHEIETGGTGESAQDEGATLDGDYLEEDRGGNGSEGAFRDEEEEEAEAADDADSPYQMRNVTFQVIQSDEDFPRDIARWMSYRKLKANCKRTQKVLKKLVHHSRNGDAESKKLARKRLERKKRDLMDVFRMPGTKWCGKGKRAAKYTSLGVFSRTDKCCRIHDTVCPYWIGGFQEKYGLFNWKLNTIMHCRCDKRFRACLKMAKTGAANLVGKLFFNIVQTQCFVLKPEEVCVKMSWWGKCEKTEYRKKAYLRDNVPY